MPTPGHDASRVFRTGDCTEPRAAIGQGRPAWLFQRAIRTATSPTYSSVGIASILIFLPLAFIGAALGWHPTVVAAFNLVSIIPLSAHLSDAADTIGDRSGHLIGGLVNATFGNTVELIVGILAINSGEIGVAQSIMVGSILSDILLVQGCCFITAAGSSGVLSVNPAVVDSLSSLMLVTTMALVLPTALYFALSHKEGSMDMNQRILSFSRATAAVLLVVYVVFLYFQLKTHSSIFMEDEDPETNPSVISNEAPSSASDEARTPSSGSSEYHVTHHHDDDDDRPSVRDVWTSVAVLALCSIAIAKCTQYFIHSLDGMTQSLGISKTFVAMVIIPLASNAPELTQVIAASRKDKVNFAISVIIGSILQISLFVLPMLVIAGWCMNRAMNLYFETSQTYILLLSVVIVNQVLQDKQYTYLHGVMLLSIYAIIAATYFV